MRSSVALAVTLSSPSTWIFFQSSDVVPFVSVRNVPPTGTWCGCVSLNQTESKFLILAAVALS